MINIINSGLGNIGSVSNMLKKLKVPHAIAENYHTIKSATAYILPGVGSFDEGMKQIEKIDLKSFLYEEVVIKKKPILGICLGMQLLCASSEEGVIEGLGFVPNVVEKLSKRIELPVPHMGWNLVYCQSSFPLYKNFEGEIRFYFTHSYAVMDKLNFSAYTTTNYGVPFISSFQSENIFGAQFHPEKSHRFGMQLLKNFSEYVSAAN